MKMKKFLAAATAAAMVFTLAACSGGSTNSSETTSDASGATSEAAGSTAASGSSVAVFYYTYSDSFIASVRSALDSALDGAGIKYQDYDSTNSQTTQNEAIDTALANGCTTLLVNLVDTGSSDAATTIIQKAADHNAKVIFFNRVIEADGQEGTVLNAYDNIAFVGTDAPEAGHLQGQMIGDYLLANYDAVDLNGDGVISYAMFKGQEGNAEAIYRTQYSVEDADAVLTEAGKPALSYFDASNSNMYQVDQTGAWSSAAALEYMNTNLSQYNETNNNMIELVICNNDSMAEGVISALQAAGYNKGEGTTTIPVFGVDATDSAKDLIAKGNMTGTVEQSATGMANALLGTVQALDGGSTMDEAIASVAASDATTYSVADDIANKLYVAYAAYTG